MKELQEYLIGLFVCIIALILIMYLWVGLELKSTLGISIMAVYFVGLYRGAKK